MSATSERARNRLLEAMRLFAIGKNVGALLVSVVAGEFAEEDGDTATEAEAKVFGAKVYNWLTPEDRTLLDTIFKTMS